MNTKQKQNWILDAVLFVIFILAFFLEITGLELHQWLGIIAGAIAVAHLVLHGNWVKAVGARFFGKTSDRSRFYFLLDGVILAGFAAMVGTGIVISSWLNLTLANYDMWKALHITASISTLLAVVIKLTAHWKWIVSFFRHEQKTALNTLQPVAVVSGRREFFKVMGVVGVASAIALDKSLRSLVQASSTDSSQALIDAQVEAQLADRVQAALDATATTQAGQTTSAVVTTEAAQATEVPTVTATAVPTATAQPVVELASQTTTNCSVRCGKGCSFPGRCRRYSDANGNEKCDLGECV